MLAAAALLAGVCGGAPGATILDVGSGNNPNWYAGAIGTDNSVYFRSLAVGHGNSGYDDNIIVGVSNFAAYQSIAVGSNNQVGLGQSDVDYTGSGAIGTDNIVAAANSFAAGEGNQVNPDPYYPASQGHILLGRDNYADAYYGTSDNILIGKNNYSMAWEGAWLIGEGHVCYSNTVMLGRFSVTPNWPYPALVVGTGQGSFDYPESIQRFNALVVGGDGQTVLSVEGWDPALPLDDPSPGTRNALTVEGHTVLKGKVILAEPQGDISMGIFGP